MLKEKMTSTYLTEDSSTYTRKTKSYKSLSKPMQTFHKVACAISALLVISVIAIFAMVEADVVPPTAAWVDTLSVLSIVVLALELNALTYLARVSIDDAHNVGTVLNNAIVDIMSWAEYHCKHNYAFKQQHGRFRNRPKHEDNAECLEKYFSSVIPVIYTYGGFRARRAKSSIKRYLKLCGMTYPKGY